VQATVFAGRYRAIRRLGSGGTATVFLARDDVLEREVAIKRVHGAEVTAATAKRLWREARIMASLRHPNLVTIYDIVTEGPDLLLVMEYIEGETLADVLGSAPLDWERTRALLEPVASALDYVHGRGVVHRDLKPSNVLVGADGSIKVADLGLATAAEITKITPPGAIMGTPAYMAPEQARPGDPTPAADVFAFATIAYQALSGTLPRWGQTVIAILAQATREPPADLREHRRHTPAAVAQALTQAMSPEPQDRQQSPSQLLGQLDAGFKDFTRNAPRPAFSDDETHPPRHTPAGAPEVHRPTPGGRRRNRTLALAALATASVAVVVVLTGQPDRERQSSATPLRSPAPQSEPDRAPSATATATPARTLSATATVRAFYRRAADGEYARAWSLAGPAMRRAFGNSRQRFSRELASLQRIRFERVAIVGRDDTGLTIEIRSVATHDDRVDRCAGTLRAIRDDTRGWFVEPAGVRCTSN
jgi:serine/threonine protein kinase